MKNSKTCPKCEATDIIRIVDPGTVYQRNAVPGGVGRTPVVRFVCAACGFTEEWIEGDLPLRQLKQYHRGKE
jgi:predicted RNA-binding Zn-ribbon protein involved in translation (DUF1610 family)